MGSSESKYKGYDPRMELKGQLNLLEDEKLIATFCFEPCEWQNTLWGSKEHPVPLGSVDGIGHVTTERIVLFWDVKAALSGESIHVAGEGASKLAELGGQEALGKFIGGVTNISSRTRKFMEARAKEWSGSHGIASFFHDQHDQNYGVDGNWLAMTSNGVFFLVLGGSLGPSPAMTFRPSYIDQDWKADDAGEFEKVLKRVDVTPRLVNSIKRGPTGLVAEYSSK